MTALNCSWVCPPAEVALQGEEIHVWCASLDQSATRVQRLAELLSTDERRRAQRFYFRLDSQRFIVARGLLRTILGRYLRVEPSRLQFRYASRGKPALTETFGGGMLRFNLSHSQGLALYAVTCGREIGVDLECIRPISDVEQIAECFFSASEAAVLRTIPAPEKLKAFFNCWTRKEAYLKALGDGLARPLDEFDVSLAPGEPAMLLNITGDAEEARRWSLQALTPAAGYVAAVAAKGHGFRLSCRQWAG